MARTLRSTRSPAAVPARSAANRTLAPTSRAARTPRTRKGWSFMLTGRKRRQKQIRDLLSKTPLSGKLVHPPGNRACLEGGETLYLQPTDSRTMGTRNNPLPKRPSHTYPTRYQTKTRADQRKSQPWKSWPKWRGCPLYLRIILSSHDRVWCAAKSCTPVHRACAEEYHGRLCLCMGLLCDWHPQGRWPNNETNPKRDKCVSCRRAWFPDIQAVMDKWCIVFSADLFALHIGRFFPIIPNNAYNEAYTRLEENDDFPQIGRNPMNVIQD